MKKRSSARSSTSFAALNTAAKKHVDTAFKSAADAQKQLKALLLDKRLSGSEFESVRTKLAAIDRAVERVLEHT